MRHFLVKFVRPFVALTVVVCATMTPSLAGACAWQAYGCKASEWRADYRPGAYSGWYDVPCKKPSSSAWRMAKSSKRWWARTPIRIMDTTTAPASPIASSAINGAT